MALSKKTFPKAAGAGAAAFDALANFETVTYTGNGGTQKITGYIRKGAAFDGSSSNIDLGTNTFNTLTSYSFSCFVNIASSKNYNFLLDAFEYNGSTSRGFGVRINSSNNVQVINYNNNTATTVTSSGTITNNTWTHIAVTNTQSNIVISIGGSIESPVSTSGFNFHSSTIYKLGAFQYTGNPVEYHLNGKLDQVRLFNTALNSTQVGQLADEEYGDAENSVTDFFGDGSGVALYQLDEDANDTGGNIGSLYTTNRELDLDVDGYTSGTVSDLSGNSYTATLNGNTTYATDSNGGGYFDFDGTGDYLSVDQTIGSSFSGDFTLEFIIEPHETGSFTYVYAKQNASTNGLLIGNFGGSNSDIEVYRQNTSGTSTINGTFTSTGITADEWQHIAIVFSGATAKLYRNGSQVSSTITGSAATYPADFTEFYIGGNYSSFDLNGRVGDFRIHTSALSDSQVLQNYNASKGSYGLGGYNGTPTNVNFLGMAFQPDFVWIKSRDATPSHKLFDSVRGISKFLSANAIDQEYTFSPYGVTSFDSNGFTIADITNGGYAVNGAPGQTYTGANADYVAWCWKAGGAASTISSGDISANVSANTDIGFSIVKYTGNGNTTYDSVPHGLNSTPELIINKGIDSLTQGTNNWVVSLPLLGAGKYAFLNTTGEVLTSSNYFGTLPDSTYFYVGGAAQVGNENAKNFISYCFHSVSGASKVGTYVGGGATNVTVTLDFAPRFVMIKRTQNTGYDWLMYDNVRQSGTRPYDNSTTLYANTSLTEDSDTARKIQFTDTGFVANNNWSGTNASGITYLYIAIA